MKKLFLLFLAAIMILSLAGCGDSASSSKASTATEATTASADVSLVDITTDSGLSMKLPSNMTLQDANGVSAYVSADKADVAAITVADNDGTPVSEQKEETFTTALQSKYSNVVMKRFDNTVKIDGKDAFVYEASLTTPAGNAVTQTTATVVTDSKIYAVNFTYKGDNSSFLAKNVQACIDSIKVTPAQ